MVNKQNPHIPSWKVWILIITTMQAISTVQNYKIHQQMWERINQTQNLLNQELQNDVEYRQNLNRSLELILQRLQ